MKFSKRMLRNQSKNYLCAPKQKKSFLFICFWKSDLNNILKRKNYVLDT